MTKTRNVLSCTFFLNEPGAAPGRAGLLTGGIVGTTKLEQVKITDPPEWTQGRPGSKFLVHCEPGIDGKLDPATDSDAEVLATLSRNDALSARLAVACPTIEQLAYTHPLRRSEWVESILHASPSARDALSAWERGLLKLGKLGYPGKRIKRVLSDVYPLWGPTSYERVWKEAAKRQFKTAAAALGVPIVPITMLRWHPSSAGQMGNKPIGKSEAIDRLGFLYELGGGCVAIHEGYIGAEYLDYREWPLRQAVEDFVAGK